jgi:hypothetical protein
MKICSRSVLNIIILSKKGKVAVYNDNSPLNFEEYFDNPKTIVVPKKRQLFLSILEIMSVKIDRELLTNRIVEIHLETFE